MNTRTLISGALSLVMAFSAMTGAIPLKCEAAEPSVLFAEDFEFAPGAAAKLLDGRQIPVGWELSDKREVRMPDILAGVDTEEKSTGNSSLSVQVTETQSVGFLSPKIKLSNTDGVYNLEYDIKGSPDYMNNTAKVTIEFYADGKLLSSTEKKATVVNGQWEHNTIYVDKAYYPPNFNNIRIRLFTVYSGKNGAKATGMVYFDNLKLVKTDEMKELEVDVRCDDKLGWYNIGDTVTFKPQTALPGNITSVTGTVFDSHDREVCVIDVTASEFVKKGWKYTPEETGWYGVEFVAHTPKEDYLLTIRFKMLTLYYSTPRRGFVVAKPTKPMEERNEILYANYYEKVGGAMYMERDDVYRLHDVLGFRGIRYFYGWQPESFERVEPINPGKGIYYWDEMDEIFGVMRKYGFKVMPCVMFTPQWASTFAENGGTVGTSKVATSNIYDFSVAPPTRLEYYTRFLELLAERYGDMIDKWEIWNEMNPASRFWEHGTTEEYVELLKASRETLHEVQPGDEVVMGGLVGGSPEYWGQLLDDGIYEYTDAMAVHGTNIKYDTYQKQYERLGLEEKPYWNTEAHYYVTNTYGTGMDFTDRDDGMRLMKGYLHDLQVGCEFIALFQAIGNKDKETLPEYQAQGLRGLSHGLWRCLPYAEPKLPAIVMHTFFDVMGKDFKYDSQYTFDSGETAAMAFQNDGKPLLIVWNQSNDFKFSNELKQCLTADSEIIDWEGRSVDPDELMYKDTFYFIKNVNLENIKDNEQTSGYLASAARVVEEQVATEVGYGNNKPLYNKKTFAVADDITWIEDNWQWRDKAGEQPEGYNARMAVSAVENDGLYIVVDVDDPDIELEFKDTEGPTSLYNSDSIQLGIDVSGKGYSDMRVEVDFGLFRGEPVLYKRNAANVDGAIPAGWVPTGSEMDAKYSQIEAKDGKIMFKIFIPFTELYPFKLENAGGELRMSILVNECDGLARIGWLRWSDGIGDGKYVGKYGKIILP